MQSHFVQNKSVVRPHQRSLDFFGLKGTRIRCTVIKERKIEETEEKSKVPREEKSEI